MKRLIVLGCLLASIFASLAEACRGGESTPPDSLASALQTASTVFLGEVISADKMDGKNVVATFKVVKGWKGPKGGMLDLPVQTGRSCDLGRFVENGTKWFVVLKEERIVATRSHSRRLFESEEEVQLIQEVDKLLKPSPRRK